MVADKIKSGQFIGKVDPDSPAEQAGLKIGDRIVEVNGVNVEHDNHKQVVEKIKSVANETKLLVVDSEADKHFKEKGVQITAALLSAEASAVVHGEKQQLYFYFYHERFWIAWDGVSHNKHEDWEVLNVGCRWV